MNRKTLSIAILLSLMATSVFAANSDNTVDKKLLKYQQEAIVLANQSVAQKAIENRNLPTALSLNVDRAVALAVENNRSIKEAKWDYEKAKAQVSYVAANKNPQISYDYTAGRAKKDTGTIQVIGNSFSNGIDLTVPIYTGGKIEGNLAAARYARESAGAKIVQLEQETKLSAAEDYYTLVMARNKIDIADQAVRDYQGHLDNVNQHYKVGLVAKSDVLASNTNLSSAQTSLVKAKNAANLAEAALDNVMGMPVYTKIETADKEMGYKPYNTTIDQANAYAMLHRSELLESILAVKQAEAQVQVAKSGNLPTVGASAGWNSSGSNHNYTGTENNGWSTGVSVSYSLWDGGQTQNNIKMAKDTLEKAKEANYETMESIMLEVRQAYLNLKSAEDTINSTKTAVTEGQENFRIASLRYRAGVGTNLDVLDAETKLESSRNDYVDALYNYNTSVAALEKAMGVPVPTLIGNGDTIVANSNSQATLDSLVAENLQDNNKTTISKKEIKKEVTKKAVNKAVKKVTKTK